MEQEAPTGVPAPEPTPEPAPAAPPEPAPPAPQEGAGSTAAPPEPAAPVAPAPTLPDDLSNPQHPQHRQFTEATGNLQRQVAERDLRIQQLEAQNADLQQQVRRLELTMDDFGNAVAAQYEIAIPELEAVAHRAHQNAAYSVYEEVQHLQQAQQANVLRFQQKWSNIAATRGIQATDPEFLAALSQHQGNDQAMLDWLIEKAMPRGDTPPAPAPASSAVPSEPPQPDPAQPSAVQQQAARGDFVSTPASTSGGPPTQERPHANVNPKHGSRLITEALKKSGGVLPGRRRPAPED